MPRRQKTEVVRARVMIEIKARLDHFLRNDPLGRSESDVVREAVLRYLDAAGSYQSEPYFPPQKTPADLEGKASQASVALTPPTIPPTIPP